MNELIRYFCSFDCCSTFTFYCRHLESYGRRRLCRQEQRKACRTKGTWWICFGSFQYVLERKNNLLEYDVCVTSYLFCTITYVYSTYWMMTRLIVLIYLRLGTVSYMKRWCDFDKF